MEIKFYTYEASEHCIACTIEAYGAENNADENGVSLIATDSEGNEIHPGFEYFEDRTMVCGTCEEIINEIESEPATDIDEVFSKENISEFFAGYLECAFWASSDDEGNGLSANYSDDDLAEGEEEKMRAVCIDFMLCAQKELRKALDQNVRPYNAAQAGHDFFLNRCGHGAGYWDRGLPGTLGDDLSEHAHSYRSEGLYVGDDGKVYSYES